MKWQQKAASNIIQPLFYEQKRPAKKIKIKKNIYFDISNWLRHWKKGSSARAGKEQKLQMNTTQVKERQMTKQTLNHYASRWRLCYSRIRINFVPRFTCLIGNSTIDREIYAVTSIKKPRKFAITLIWRTLWVVIALFNAAKITQNSRRTQQGFLNYDEHYLKDIGFLSWHGHIRH